MKVLIVEDDTSSRILLKKILAKQNYEIEIATNGLEAKELVSKIKFDAVLTDWMMPELDGLELIKYIRRNVIPAPAIIMITALSSREACDKALNAGADDYITKPIYRDEVLLRLGNCLNRKTFSIDYDFDVEEEVTELLDFYGVCIATSTGGPQTLTYFFKNLKSTKKAAFFIVLHGPSWMLKNFPEKLQEVTDMNVCLGKEGEEIKPGNIYLAPGEVHMIVDSKTKKINLIDTPPENFVKPSADPLFKSVSKIFGKNTLGIVLTGMGRDGTIGSGYVNAAGGVVFAQDPATAILPSMPASVIELKIAKKVLDIESLAKAVDNFVL